MSAIRIVPLADIPEIRAGDDLCAVIRGAAGLAEGERRRDAGQATAIDGKTILVVAQKIVSKAEGAVVDLRTIEPSVLAKEWAARWRKDPRLIELIFRQSRRIVKMERGVLICETRHGFVMANAGVDQSNVPGEAAATLLPDDPDASAERLRLGLGCGAAIIADTFGRPWREGLVNAAIGVAGLEPIEDLRGQADRCGRSLQSTVVAFADELAAAAGLVMPKAGGFPVALIYGVEWKRSGGSARQLIRPPDQDLFR